MHFLVQGCRRQPRSPAQLIDGLEYGDLAQPERQVLARLDRLQVAVQLHEDVLRQILRKVLKSQHSQRQAVDGSLMRPNQRGESLRIAHARLREFMLREPRNRLIQRELAPGKAVAYAATRTVTSTNWHVPLQP